MKRNYSLTVMLTCILVIFPFLPLQAHEEGGHSGKKLFTKHFGESLFDITEKAGFSVEILPDDKEYDIGKNVVGIVLHDDHDQDVSGTEIRMTTVDSDTRQRESVQATITDRKNGLYIVSGLDLTRKGAWELIVDIRKGLAEDRVTFAFPKAMTKPYPKGKYSP